MKFTKLFTEERAVSPVIGVILMVAITVILAAVIGTFVLGLGDSASDKDPQVAFKFSYDGTDVTVAHNGGDSIDTDLLTIKSSGTVSGDTFTGDFQVGDEAKISGVSSGDTIKLVYGDSVIGTYTVP